LRFAQHVHVLAVAVRHALEELVDVEVVYHTRFAALARCWVKEAAVGVEKGSETSYEGCADLVCPEGHWTDQCDAGEAAVVGDDSTAW
jgi:hypothetical protein